MTSPWRGVGLAVVGTLLAFGCTADDQEPAAETPATETSPGDPVPTGPSPGVTDDAIKIGVTYVDADTLAAIGIDFDIGDLRGTYQALIDEINADGGINGRMLDPVFAPIDPTDPASAENACLRLTEDEQVFVATGPLLADAPVCYLDVHETAALGGTMTEARLELVGDDIPWYSTFADFERPIEVINRLDEAGALDGTIGIYGITQDEQLIDEVIKPALVDVGVTDVETGINSAPIADTVAFGSAIQTIAENFSANGVDTVILPSASGAGWPTYLQDDDSYRPRLLFVDITGARSFATNEATRSLDVLDDSLAGGGFGPEQAVWDEADMQACVATLTEAGVDLVSPDDASSPSDQTYQAPFLACPDIALLRALLEAAGDDLNYGTLNAGADGLEVKIPGDPTPRVYGPPPAGDGDPDAYLYEWDPDTEDFVVVS